MHPIVAHQGGTESRLTVTTAPSFIAVPTPDERHLANVGDHRAYETAAVDQRAYTPADDESRNWLQWLSRRNRKTISLIRRSPAKYTRELLEAMKYKGSQKLAQERYGIELCR